MFGIEQPRGKLNGARKLSELPHLEHALVADARSAPGIGELAVLDGAVSAELPQHRAGQSTQPLHARHTQGRVSGPPGPDWWRLCQD